MEILRKLIAERRNIKPEEVTPQFILEQREKITYPNMKLVAPTRMSSLSRNEIKRLEEIMDEILELV